MPRDVRTRWNSTYDMLRFALKYKQVVKSMTETRELDLRELELSPEEWKLAQQLADVLKVRHTFQTIEIATSRASPTFSMTQRCSDHLRIRSPPLRHSHTAFINI